MKSHKYIPSQLDATKCQICKFDMISHTDFATCDCCPTIGPVEIFMTMKMCPFCIEKETKLQEKSKIEAESRITEVKDSERVSNLLGKSKEIDYSVEVKNDIFNAETISLKELTAAIAADELIKNKPFELARVVKERILHFQKVFFDCQEEAKVASTKQRFWQQQANQLVSKLRDEERKELQLENINYKPPSSKPVKIKPVTTVGKKYDKVELVEWANKGGWPLSVLQSACVSKGMNPEQAYNYLKSKGF